MNVGELNHFEVSVCCKCIVSELVLLGNKLILIIDLFKRLCLFHIGFVTYRAHARRNCDKE